MIDIIKIRIKLFLSKKSMMLIFIVFPLIFSVLSLNYLKTDDFEIRTSIGVVDLDNSEFSRNILRKMKTDEALTVKVFNEWEGEEELKKENIIGLYIIKEGFSDEVKSGRTNGIIEVKYLSDNYTAPGITDLITPYFLSDIIKEKTKILVNNLEFSDDSEKQEEFAVLFDDYTLKYEDFEEFKLEVIVKSIEETNGKISLYSSSKEIVIRYFLSIILIFLIISAIYQSIYTTVDKEDKIIRRIKLSGRGFLEYLSGNIIGIALIVFFIGIIQILVIRILFFDYISFLDIALNLMVYSLSVTLLAFVLIKLFYTASQLQLVLPYIVIIIWFFGGWVYSDTIIKAYILRGFEYLPGMIIKEDIIKMFLSLNYKTDIANIINELKIQFFMIIFIYALGRMDYGKDSD
jgi:hypothetical protein